MKSYNNIPQEWTFSQLGDVTYMKQGSVLAISMFTDIGFPVYGANGQIGFYREYTHEQSEVLVTCRGATCGTVNLSPPKAFITNNAMIVTPKNKLKLHKFFLRYALMETDLSSSITGSGQPQITKGKLSLCQIPLPPLPEQKAIAYVLRTVQQAKEKTEKVIAAARELKRSLMKHLFTYGPVPFDQADQVELQETEIGEIPKEWDIGTVEEAGKIITGTTPSTKNPSYYGGVYPFITPGDIDAGKNVKIISKTLSDEGLSVSRCLPANTVLVVCIGATIGKTALTDLPCSTTNQQINAIIPHKNIDADFLYYALTYRSSELPSLAGRAAIPIVNKSNFSNFVIPFPPSIHQKKIGNILSTIDRYIEVFIIRQIALDTIFRSLLHNLMTGKIRVNDLHIPNIEEVA